MKRRCSPFPTAPKTDPDKSRARLCRWTFDLAGNPDRFAQTYLDDVTGEFPRIDDGRAGFKSGHGWYACANPNLPMFGALSGIVHVDGNGKRCAKCRASNTLFGAGVSRTQPGEAWPKAVAGCFRVRQPRRREAAISRSSMRA